MSLPNLSLIVRNNQTVTKNSFEKTEIKLEKHFLNECSAGNLEIPHKNGISTKKINITKDKGLKSSNVPLTTTFCSLPQSLTNHRKNLLPKGKLEFNDIEHKTTVINHESRIPMLMKENETCSKRKLLRNSSIFNQRYQNVMRFPNYRQRKKSAFEKKLRRCGVELDGESTISNLRKILQPYIYQEINNILERYIEVYFMKAFNNIRENVNLASENWSQTLKCSISKSLYKQYCDSADVEPFTSSSIAEDDFPYFKTTQKVNHKDHNVIIENFFKSEVDNSTGHTSDSNSHCSHFTTGEDKLETDKDLNMGEISSSSEHTLDYENQGHNCYVNNYSNRKRSIQQVTQTCTQVSQNSSKFSEPLCSQKKYSKISFPPHSFSRDHFESHNGNNSDSFILQTLQKSDEPKTARFESHSEPFFMSRNAIDPGIYLSVHDSMTVNSAGDHVFPNNYRCKKM